MKLTGAGAYRGIEKLRNRITTVLIRRSFASFGRRSVIAHPVRLGGTEHIEIGASVWIGAGSWLQVIGEHPQSPLVKIGDMVSMSGMCVISAVHHIEIGDGALFARNVYVADHSHAFDDPTRPIVEQGEDNIAPVHIGAGCWLGQNVVVLPGATIGAGAVIGANSVVRGDIPARTIAVGAPARVVRRLDEETS